MARVIVIGSGYVGTALARLLASQGHEVWGLRRSAHPNADGVQYLSADVLRPETLQWPECLDAAVYCVSPSSGSETAYRSVYVDGLRNVLSSLSVERFLLVGSTGVYHQQEGSWLDERSPADSQSPTGKILLEGEALARHADGAIIVRLSGIYGPGRTRLIDSVRDGTARRFRDSTAVLNHIHRDDCAGALAHLVGIENPAPLYLATDCEPVYKNDALCWIAQQLGVPPPKESMEPAPQQRGGHRFYSNRRLLDSGYALKYPTYREGYGALLES